METEKLPVNIYISSNNANNPESIQAIQKGIQEALEKFEGKSIIYFHVKNILTGPVGRHHPPHHWEDKPGPKFGHHKGRHHHGGHHFKGRHGQGPFRGRFGPRRANWWYHSAQETATFPSGQVDIREIPNTPNVETTNEKDRTSKSSDEWCLLDYRSTDEKHKSDDEENEELRERFDNMDVTKSV